MMEAKDNGHWVWGRAGRLRRVILLCLAVLGVGYLSDVLTRKGCEDWVARSLAEDPMRGERFYIEYGDHSSYEIFFRIHADVREYVTFPLAYDYKRVIFSEGGDVPHVNEGGRMASVREGRILFPFIVTVYHEAQWGSTGGETASTHFLCLLGIPVKIVKCVHEVS